MRFWRQPDSTPWGEISAIHKRARKYKRAWSSHLEQAIDFQQNYLKSGDWRGKTVTILGSGLLLETPLDLYRSFAKIICADRIHHPDVQFVAQGNRQIELRVVDLNRQSPDWDADLWVSANVLSQLPRDRIELLIHGRVEEFQEYRRESQSRHWAFLKEKAHYLLWSDFAIAITNRKGFGTEKEATLDPGVKLPFTRDWKWSLVPASFFRSGVTLHVGALSR